MFSPAITAQIPEWNLRKQEQWERLRPEVVDGKLIGHPLEMVRSGQSNTRFMLSWNSEGFQEAVLIGQLPQTHKIKVRPREFRDAKPSELPLEKRKVDLTDDEISLVLKKWAKGQSALTLDFIPSVWVRGKEQVKS
jgi:hypothetical protein